MKELSVKQMKHITGGDLVCAITADIIGDLICGFLCGFAADLLFCPDPLG